jgi:hypothetical protein
MTIWVDKEIMIQMFKQAICVWIVIAMFVLFLKAMEKKKEK